MLANANKNSKKFSQCYQMLTNVTVLRLCWLAELALISLNPATQNIVQIWWRNNMTLVRITTTVPEQELRSSCLIS